MSSIISLVSQKGGVGKSGIARLLAVEFSRAGWSVKIADLDTMQGSATRWKLRRDAAQLQPEIPVEKFATVERALREAEKYDLLLIDGPAHAEKGGLSMARKSKVILMPTCYGLDDLEAQSIFVFREAFARLKNIALLWSLGKDSNVMIWVARKFSRANCKNAKAIENPE